MMTVWPEDYGRIILNDVDSTSNAATKRAKETPVPFWLLAHRQTAGRGRRGRVWAMPGGNFAATLVLRPHEPPAQVALRSFVMSLALYRSFVEITGRESAFALKWPNDVLLNGGKVAGILLETSGVANEVNLLSIGVGVNLVAVPDQSDLEDTALLPVSVAQETSVVVGAEEFLSVLAHHYALLERQFQDFGFAPIRRGWLDQAARIGEVIVARTSRDTYTGTFEDVDADGQLVLRGDQGLKTIAAADVYF